MAARVPRGRLDNGKGGVPARTPAEENPCGFSELAETHGPDPRVSRSRGAYAPESDPGS